MANFIIEDFKNAWNKDNNALVKIILINVIVFVSGKKSSNGKMLFESCKSKNSNSYFISDVDEINKNWFSSVKSVGICGATSTPMWLMEKVSDFISKIN